ncbi:ABC transporter ATP-binding protein [Dietzia sp.]|uniref:ABC transporter ATP-binding protein n=1 Tax=Dietzia sp. TaxID=1871616 RepID=UPI002FD8B867
MTLLDTVRRHSRPGFETPPTPSAPTGAAAELSGVRRAFGDTTVLDGLDLRISTGEIVSLIGRSGSGKSTALRLLAGLDGGATGGVRTSGTPSVVFQTPSLLPWRTVAGNVAHGLNQIDVPAKEKARRVAETLAEVGLDEHGDSYPGELSGGQAQRASLARALVGEPGLLLLDEPFSALDALTRGTMHSLLLSLWERHRFGVLLVTHDVDEAIALSDRVDVLRAGRIARSAVISDPRSGRPDPDLKAELLAVLDVAVQGATEEAGE